MILDPNEVTTVTKHGLKFMKALDHMICLIGIGDDQELVTAINEV